MGEVYEAIHVGLNKPVVVKLLHQAMANDPRYADRLRIEAQTLASVESPYLVSVSDIGCTPEGRSFFVMELLHGATLRQVLDRRGPLRPTEAIQWAIQALTGLAAAHRRGIVHRDVKLDNLFLCDRTPERDPIIKVLDFGVAKVLESAGLPFPGPTYATEENALVGTPRYVSPEQVRFEAVDARTDVYAVGVMLYTLLVGRGPFPNAADVLALLNAHLLEVPRPPSQVAPRPLPPELDRAVLKAMAKRPESRFQSAELFADALRGVADLLADMTRPLPSCAAAPAPSPEPGEPDTPAGQTTACGTWIMAPPGGARAPASGRWTLSAIEERSLAAGSEAQRITVLPQNLAEPSAPSPPAQPASPGQLDSRVFIAITLASSVLFSALFVIALRLLRVL
jgi:eukaryotic-like serine/threonine-protein kinase